MKNFSIARFCVALWVASIWTDGVAQINPAVMPTSGALSQQSVSRLLLTDVTRFGSRLVAVGDRGYIVFSDNNGAAWQRAETPANVPLLTGVAYSDAKVGWAVGHDSFILTSRDEGKTWTRAFSAPDDQKPLMDIHFVDANVGFAVGAYAAFYETTDAGKTWTSRKTSPAGADGKSEDRHFNAILRVSERRLLIVGEAGTVLRSDDNGKTWVAITAPYKGSYFGGVVAADGSVVIFGLRGRIYRSSDANLSTWEQIDNVGTASMMGGTRLADGGLVLTGLSGTVMVSRDNGKTFAAIKSGSTKALAAPISGGAANKVIIVGEAGPRDMALAAVK